MNGHRQVVVCVIGTRPEAIKMAPVVSVLKSSTWAQCIVVVTAQHRDLLDQMLSRFNIVVDHDLDLMKAGQEPSDLVGRMLPQLGKVLADERADIVLAQGDTTTTFVAALAAFHLQIPFGHIEAGLRTHDLAHPFPEEGYRQMVSRITRWHFAPTERAAQALIQEGIDAQAVYVTGNTGIDALMQIAAGREIGHAGLGRMILLTAHRRENFGEPLRAVFRAIREILNRYADVTVVYPVHPNPNVQREAKRILSGHSRIMLIAPQDYFDFVDIMRRATLILTDSGGIQEEAPALGKPVLVIRETTERPEAVEQGHALLVGTAYEGVVGAIAGLLDDPDQLASMSRVGNPFGDGTAAKQIETVLSHYVGAV